MKKLLIYFALTIIAALMGAGLTACATEPPPPAYYSHYHPYDYYYYPSVGIYFRYSTGYYYYPSGSVWIKTRKLPPRYRLDQHDRIIIRMDNDKPYKNHYQHQERYRSRPDYRPDPYRDEKERYYNQRQYEEYRRRK